MSSKRLADSYTIFIMHYSINGSVKNSIYTTKIPDINKDTNLTYIAHIIKPTTSCETHFKPACKHHIL